jgi:molecular chaperone GrpE
MVEDKQPEEIEEKTGQPEDVASLKKALAEAEAQAKEYLASWQRSQADFVNYKRRSEQEQEETKQFANSVLICNLLPVIDDLERALESVPKELADMTWVEGIRLIERKFKSILESHGVTPIQAKGQHFDPTLHEAAMCSHGREGVVTKELKKGYRLRDKVIRPATVAVGSGESAGPTEHKSSK